MKRVLLLILALSILLTPSIIFAYWTKDDAANPVLSNGTSGKFDEAQIGTACVIYDAGTWKMWYTGMTLGEIQAIGYATSSDTKSWTKHNGDGGPVLTVGTSGKFDETQLSMGWVIKDGSTYRMWYNGYSGTTVRIGYATSSERYNRKLCMDIKN